MRQNFSLGPKYPAAKISGKRGFRILNLGIAVGGLIGSIIAAVVGAVILLALLRLIKRA